MFAAQRKSIIDSKKSSDKEVECFKKRIINRISSNSSSDDEESYTRSTAKIHRKLLGPIFNEQVLSNYIEKIVQNSNKLVRVLENFNGQEIDVLKYIQLCNVNAVYECFLGIDLDLLTNLDFKLINSLSRIVETSMARAYKFWLHPDIIFYNLPVGKKYLEDISYLNNITNKVIRDYKESREKKKSIKKSLEENSGKNNNLIVKFFILCNIKFNSNKIFLTIFNSILFILLNKGSNSTPFLETVFESFCKGGEYTEQDIKDEINTLILAGSDTATNTITFAFLMLATYPEIQVRLINNTYFYINLVREYYDFMLHICWQEKLYQELYNIYGSSDVEDVLIAYQDMKEMKFLERFIKETLRFFPTVPYVWRNVSEDIKVNDNFTLPKNATIHISIYALHHNKKFWENPEEFNPDRFLSGKHHNSTCFK
ncbi:hypothetical protein M0802_015420, partial [Mischocyttarus mexicanus]